MNARADAVPGHHHRRPSAEEQPRGVGPSTEAPWWRAHLPLLASASVVIFTAVQLLALSGYSVETAQTVLGYIGTGSVIIGGIISMIAIVPPSGAVLAGALAIRRHRRGTPARSLAFAAFALAGMTLLVTPWPLVLCYVGLLLVSVPRGDSSPQSGFASRVHEFVASGSFAMVSVSVGIAIATPLPWLPTERVHDPVTQRTYVGYVLANDAPTLVLLTSDRATVERLPLKDGLTRSLCERRDSLRLLFLAPPIMSLWQPRTHYPAC